MSEQLTKEQLQLSIEAIEFALAAGSHSEDDVVEAQEVLRKLRGGLVALDRHERMRGTVEPERFPAVVSREEAQRYSDIGEDMMVAAAQGRVDEGIHHKLSCLMIGLTSSLSRIMQVPREKFCNQLVTNVMFTALKAAYVIPSASQEKAADGNTSE